MAYYNINKVISLTRKAKGISQEELSYGICTPATLSRYENGKHRVNKKKYRQLMERMGRMYVTKYAVCIDKSGGLLEDRMAMERAFKRYDYEMAEKHLLRMKEQADDNVLTQQYVARAEAKLDYRLGRISGEEKIEWIDKAIRMTVPEYDTYLEKWKSFPFVEEELMALMSLGEAYRNVKNYEKAIQIDKWIDRCIDTGYIGKPEKLMIPFKVKENMSKIYEEQGEHERALQLVNECLQEAKEIECGYRIAPLLTSKAYNYIQLVKKGIWTEEKLEDAKSLLQQAYLFAAARGDKVVVLRIITYYKRYFGEWVID